MMAAVEVSTKDIPTPKKNKRNFNVAVDKTVCFFFDASTEESFHKMFLVAICLAYIKYH